MTKFYWYSATQAKVSGTRTVVIKGKTITYTELSNSPTFKSHYPDAKKVGEA